jgi:hypothetical protein
VFEAAVSNQSGEAFFDFGASTAMGHLSDSGGLKVRMVSLDDLFSAGMLEPPDYIKLDVEGAEYDALRGAEEIIDKFQPVLFLDTHQRTAHQNTIQFLEQKHYHFEILDGKSSVETKELIARPQNSIFK